MGIPQLPRDVGRILVFACNLLGDSICRLPAIKAAKESHPGSALWVVADARSGEVFSGQPFIDAVRPLERRGGPAAQARAWGSLARWARRLRPDFALDLYGSRRSALACRVSGARWRAGLHREGNSRWYNLRPRPGEPVPQSGHLIQRINSYAALAGIRAPFAYCPLAVSDDHRAAAAAALAACGLEEGRPLIVLNPAARVPAKRWAAERFAELARRVQAETGAACAVATAPEDIAVSDEVAGRSRGAARALPALPLKQLAAVLEGASLLVTGDTGVLHVGMAMGAATVVLAGPTDPELVACAALPQVILFHRDACPEWAAGEQCPRYNTCQDRRCIDAVTVEEAVPAVRRALELSGGKPPPASGGFTQPERAE